ncbi:hypothetical protein HMPREF9131_0283, partial [Peptoniphilus sp. oral taxon 836 str. F0141]
MPALCLVPNSLEIDLLSLKGKKQAAAKIMLPLIITAPS